MRAQIVILSSFAMLWGLATWALAGAPAAFAALPPLITALLILAGWTLLPPAALADQEFRRIRRIVRLWSFVEVAAMLVAVISLQHFHKPELIPAAIAMIVGLHFLPLARGFPQKWFYLAALGLVGAGLVAPFLPEPSEEVFPLLAGAIVLWTSAAGIIVSRRRERTAGGA